jgi:hypothetical protein
LLLGGSTYFLFFVLGWESLSLLLAFFSEGLLVLGLRLTVPSVFYEMSARRGRIMDDGEGVGPALCTTCSNKIETPKESLLDDAPRR